MITIYHNPNCSKSRACVNDLVNINHEYVVINIIENPMRTDEIQEIINKLGIHPIDLVRKKETLWINNFGNKNLSDSEIIDILTQNPSLIERPIVMNNNKAIIARPFEKIYEILN